MRVVIAGGHGKIALLLERALTAAGHTAVGLVRNPEHVADVVATGADAVVTDLESADVATVSAALRDADAAVFAAGAGPNSGAPRKDSVDRAAAVLLADAAEQAGVRRIVQIGALGVESPPQPGGDPVWAAYLAAKLAAEDDLRRRDLDWVILRPGRLTDEPGTGLVDLAGRVVPGSVPRADVAAVIVALLGSDVSRRVLELVGGDTPVDAAVAGL